MRAVLADISTPRYLLTTAAQKVPQGLGKKAGWGRGGILRLVDDYPAPALPKGDGWVRLRPELSGICGSDLAVAHAKSSFVLSAFYRAEKQILGHEMVAVVDEVGPGTTKVQPGDRAIIDPVLSCHHRGFDPVCRSCAEGFPYICERADEPGVCGCAAPTLGFDAALGGGWGEQVVAHESQLYPAAQIPSKRAVLAEPASIGLHAALQWERRGDRAVVIGPGTIGLLVTAALRMLHPDLDIIVVSPDEFGSQKALEAGATRIVSSGPSAVEELAASDGGRVVRARMTKIPILEQGVDAVFDCVALPQTLDLAMHLLRPTGMLVLVGGAGKQDVDWSLVWNRQLTVQGTINSGPEPKLGGRETMAQVVDWLADDEYPVDGIVTHTFGLNDWKQAMETASAGSQVKSVKTTLRPNPDIPLVE
ncbi:MAG: zinc-dependent alcohol dehydrogenase [Candidatus Nanopelagicales bacterium]